MKIRYEGNVGPVKLHFKMYTKLLFLTWRRNATYEQEYLAFSKLGWLKDLHWLSQAKANFLRINGQSGKLIH